MAVVVDSPAGGGARGLRMKGRGAEPFPDQSPVPTPQPPTRAHTVKALKLEDQAGGGRIMEAEPLASGSSPQPDSAAAASPSESEQQGPRLYDKEKRRAHKHRRRARAQAAHFDDLNGVLLRLEAMDLQPRFQCLCEEKQEARVDWAALPELCDPVRNGQTGGLVNEARAQRKRWQVESMAVLLRGVLQALEERRCQQPSQALRVVDFCSASGVFSLPLAALFPHCHFVLVDYKAAALQLAADMAMKAGLTNVETRQGALEDYHDHFDVALGMHACGFLTDLVQEKAMERGAAYLLCPCCVGNLKQSVELALQRAAGTDVKAPKTRKKRLTTTQLYEGRFQTMRDGGEEGVPLTGLEHPRSRRLQASMTLSEYLSLVRAADYGQQGHRLAERFHLAKEVVELDRQACAAEAGYWTTMTKLWPLEASAKHHVLVGLPPGACPPVEWGRGDDYVEEVEGRGCTLPREEEEEQALRVVNS